MDFVPKQTKTDKNIIKWDHEIVEVHKWVEPSPYSRKKYTPETLNEALAHYFNTTPIEEYSYSELCMSLGITQKTFNLYGHDEDLSEMVEMAKTRISASYERDLRNKKIPTGAIFALKAQAGWRDDAPIQKDEKPVIQIINYSQIKPKSDESDQSTV